MKPAHTFRGHRTVDGLAEVSMDGETLTAERSLKIRNHSPTGFEWGYAGSGPAQLALALCLESMKQKDAERFYQDFKFEFVANWKDKWMMKAESIRFWLHKHKAKIRDQQQGLHLD